MGKLNKRGGLPLAAFLLALSASHVAADDLLVMPYGCTMLGGRPQLLPSQDQSHRIIGGREQRSFRTCSPVNPTLCRQWTVHRFEMDCDGVSLPWATVVANARPDRAWLENGRLHLRMPPSWSMAPDDPCAGGVSGGERWRYGRLQRYCADRRALTPPASVEMPPGFAPLLGIDAIFVSPKSVAQVHASAPAPAPTAPFAPNLTRPEPAVPAAPNLTRPEPAAPSAPTVTRTGPTAPIAQSVPGNEPPASAPRPAQPAPASSEAPAVAPVPGAPVIPRIINRPEAVAESAPVTTGTVVRNEPPPPQAHVLAARPEAPMPETSSFFSVRLAIGVLAGVLVAVSAVTLLVVRGLARPQLGSDSGKRSGTRKDVATRREPTLASPVWTTAFNAAWNDEVPRTRSDALRVLGMGVAPDSNLAAIKKIVDGLRQTWHPDLARDAADRELRERRMKQINVAWDILGAKAARS